MGQGDPVQMDCKETFDETGPCLPVRRITSWGIIHDPCHHHDDETEKPLRHQRSLSLPISPVGTPSGAARHPVTDVGTLGPDASKDLENMPLFDFNLEGQVLGGGAKGIVQLATDPDQKNKFAVKRLECDLSCPVRFLEICKDGGEVLHIEGFLPTPHKMQGEWSGRITHIPSNPHAAEPLDPDTLNNCIVLVRRGGGIPFLRKCLNVQSSGARGIVFINGDDSLEPYSVGTIDAAPLPTLLIMRSDGEAALEMLSSNQLETASCCNATVRTDVGHELMICKRLPPHQHVVKMLNAWQEGEGAVMVMELCSGGRLSSVPSAIPQALLLMKQMLMAIAHLHAYGVCHRDIKPDNLLLTQPIQETGARLVLIDFSMASTAHRMCVACGSPRYLAPEVLCGTYNLKCDLWSAGVVADELLFGQHYLGEASDNKILDFLASEKPVHIPHATRRADEVPQLTCDMLLGLLLRNPEKRLTALEALEHPCFRDPEG